MGLQEKLQEMKAASAGKIPAEIRATMQGATQRLVDSDILQHVVKVGDKLVDFTLSDASGKDLGLQELRQQGPVVISLYRGVW